MSHLSSIDMAQVKKKSNFTGATHQIWRWTSREKPYFLLYAVLFPKKGSLVTWAQHYLNLRCLFFVLTSLHFSILPCVWNSSACSSQADIGEMRISEKSRCYGWDFLVSPHSTTPWKDTKQLPHIWSSLFSYCLTVMSEPFLRELM